MVCFILIYIDYSNSGYPQNVPYGTYPQASQQAAMTATSYPAYSATSSVGSTPVYTSPSQVAVPGGATYGYATGQTAAQYAAPPPVASYAAYQVPAAPASSAASLAPPPIVGTDAAQYGVRPPPPPPPPNQQNVSFRCRNCVVGEWSGVIKNHTVN